MYRARHKPSGQDIIILDRRWAGQVEYLRALDRKNDLVCPGCREPVRVRAGQVKRWHFAHKHLKNCPFSSVSPTLLNIRAVLYRWLLTQFGENHVRVEENLDSPGFRRPVDCWVHLQDRKFPYWILDRRMPPDERANLQAAFKSQGLNPHWIFASQMLRIDDFQPRSRLHLTTTERAFTRTTKFDPAWQTHFERLGGTLHYLDPDLERLTTYRNLTVCHPPQLYIGTRLENALGEIRVLDMTGEFIHPGEIEQRHKRQAEVEHRQQKAADRLRKAEAFFYPAAERHSTLSYPKAQVERQPSYERRGTCKYCGIVTTDWLVYDGESGDCVCRGCKDRLESE